MGINSSEQKMEAFRKIAVIVIGGGQVQIKCPKLPHYESVTLYQLPPTLFKVIVIRGHHQGRSRKCFLIQKLRNI